MKDNNPPREIPTVLDLAARLVAEGWDAITAFAEAQARIALMERLRDNPAEKSCTVCQHTSGMTPHPD